MKGIKLGGALTVIGMLFDSEELAAADAHDTGYMAWLSGASEEDVQVAMGLMFGTDDPSDLSYEQVMEVVEALTPDEEAKEESEEEKDEPEPK